MKFNQSARKLPAFKFEKYQCAVLGSSSSDSVANIEKKFGKAISWVCMDCFKKPAEKVEF